MSVPIDRLTVLNFLILSIFAIAIGWLWLRTWYFRLISNARDRVYDCDGKKVLGATPKMLLGNIPDVYDAENQLSAYHSFHQKFGEVVQIFWLWRSQLSVSNYGMAQRILVNNQRNYQKFPPNSITQQLFGESVLTFPSTSNDWKRHRLLLNEVFTKKQVTTFHHIFTDYSDKLADRWQQKIGTSGANIELDIYPGLLALSLDIIGRAAIGKDFAALSGEADEFLNALKYIVYQSTKPAHQFTTWWKHIPISSNRQLDRAFKTVDRFLDRLIEQRQAEDRSDSANVLDLLLQATDCLETEVQPLSKKEVRDNLLAIVANGHETVAASIALSLYYLAQDPAKLTRARTEVDRVMAEEGGKLTEAGVKKLDYLNCVILETLRFSPPMAGLQRISCDPDLLSGWSIPAEQVVGITLNPLHRNSEYFGERAEEFHPERYLESEVATVATTSISEVTRECPIKKFLPSHRQNTSSRTKNGIHLPLTFGDGARKCLAEHFAMYEMKVILATMLYNFDFQPAANFEAELELGKFGLFLTTFPKHGIKVKLDTRTH